MPIKKVKTTKKTCSTKKPVSKKVSGSAKKTATQKSQRATKTTAKPKKMTSTKKVASSRKATTTRSRKPAKVPKQEKRPTIENLHLVNFTAFKDFKMAFSPGINAIIGENASGKTHILKAMYAGCNFIPQLAEVNFEMFSGYFGVSDQARWNVVRCGDESHIASIELNTSSGLIGITLNDTKSIKSSLKGKTRKEFLGLDGTYIPPKDILVHGRKFRKHYEARLKTTFEMLNGKFPMKSNSEASKGIQTLQKIVKKDTKFLYAMAELLVGLTQTMESQNAAETTGIYFEKVYRDILIKLLEKPQVSLPQKVKSLQKVIEGTIGGKIALGSEEYLLKGKDFSLELSYVSEGFRKFALLWLLINNGTICPGSILFWDEPESNMNPKLMGAIVKIMLMLEQMNVQVFFATHSYVILKELDLQREKQHKVVYHSLFHDEEAKDIRCKSVNDFAMLEPNDILDTYTNLFHRQMQVDLREDD